jgi:hypothetical protein
MLWNTNLVENITDSPSKTEPDTSLPCSQKQAILSHPEQNKFAAHNLKPDSITHLCLGLPGGLPLRFSKKRYFVSTFHLPPKLHVMPTLSPFDRCNVWQLWHTQSRTPRNLAQSIRNSDIWSSHTCTRVLTSHVFSHMTPSRARWIFLPEAPVTVQTLNLKAAGSSETSVHTRRHGVISERACICHVRSSFLAPAVGCETNESSFAEGNTHNKTNSTFLQEQNNSIWYWYLSVAMNFITNNSFTTATSDLSKKFQKDRGNNKRMSNNRT